MVLGLKAKSFMRMGKARFQQRQVNRGALQNGTALANNRERKFLALRYEDLN